MSESVRQSLGSDNPWPGLAPFDEIDREYFRGRDAEVVELLRLVRRELLTVLFGRSGLGKTSLLRAGLFRKLRDEDLLPVYVRLDHADGTPPLREQVLRELRAACDDRQVEATRPEAQETLWSFFHRRNVEFWSVLNRPVTPVIVFDPFEEIFVRGQEGEAARARSAEFLAELADLVENQPPASVMQALEQHPATADRYDFRRANVKLVLSFREDFLAEIEGLKAAMPSLMYNRFRLLPMDGTQAYAVVTESGGALVDDEVARRILRLAWKNERQPPVEREEFPRIEIDPALLSVVCSELNHRRQQMEPPLAKITPALLADADREILAGFYERSMAGLDDPVRVRSFVEDKLLTDRGFRSSYDWDDARAVDGVSPEALEELIAKRLLRVDERQGQRRLELTHDVLTGVVKDSRDRRRVRQAQEAAEERERAAVEQQRRNRRNGMLVLLGGLLVLLLVGVAAWKVIEARNATALLEQEKVVAGRATKLAEKKTQEAFDSFEQAAWSEADAEAQQHKAKQATDNAARLVLEAEAEKQRADRLGIDAQQQKRKANQLLAEARSARLVEEADRLQDSQYDTALLVNLEALHAASTEDSQAGLLRRLSSHPHLSVFLFGHKAVYHVAFSPDGKRLASASKDQTVILWDVDSRKPLATLEGHKDWVFGVAFSPDGKRLASASKDQTVILWDVDSRKPLATLEGHKDAVLGVAFSPDGKRLASASWDRTVILWDLNPESLKADACRTANRNLTCAEWPQHIGADIPYRRTCEVLPGPPKTCN